MTQVAGSVLTDAVIYLGLPLGLWISLRILSFPDLSIEQSFVFGGVIYALTRTTALTLPVALIVLALCSISLGLTCAMLRDRFNVHPIIISLCLAYLYYSVSLILLGGPNRFFGHTQKAPTLSTVIFISSCVFFVVIALLSLFQKLPPGLKVIASGSNSRLAKRHGISTVLWQGLGLGLSFVLPMISGMLFSWRAGNIDISYGSGFLLITVFVVVISNASQRRIRILSNCLLLLIFLTLYLSLLQIAITIGMPTQWLRGATALALLSLVLSVPRSKDAVLQF